MSRALLIGVTGTALALAAVALDPDRALSGWLAAFAFWAGVPLGALLLLLLIRVLPGAWSAVLARVAAPAALLAPLVAAAGLPVAFDLGAIYPWTHGGLATPFRAAYLSAPFFLVRSLVFLAAFYLAPKYGVLAARRRRAAAPGSAPPTAPLPGRP